MTGPTGASGPNGPTGALGATGPTGAASAVGGVLASGVAPSATTENPAYTDLIALPVTVPANGELLIEASFAAAALVTAGAFRLAIDGVAVPSATSEIAEFPSLATARFLGGAIIRHVTGITPGAHTVSLQWRSGPAGVLIVASNPDRSHASLVVKTA